MTYAPPPRGHDKPSRLILFALLGALTFTAPTAHAQSGVDVLFVLEESNDLTQNTLEEERQLIANILQPLDTTLAEDFDNRRYGIFGFGGDYDTATTQADAIGRTYAFRASDCAATTNDWCSSHQKSWGSLNDLRTPFGQNFDMSPFELTNGARSDGWAALQNAISTYWDDEPAASVTQARLVFMLTNPLRDSAVSAPTYAETLESITDAGVSVSMGHKIYPFFQEPDGTALPTGAVSDGVTATLADGTTRSVGNDQASVNVPTTVDPSGSLSNPLHYSSLVYQLPTQSVTRPSGYTPQGCLGNMIQWTNAGLARENFETALVSCLATQAQLLAPGEMEEDEEEMMEVIEEEMTAMMRVMQARAAIDGLFLNAYGDLTEVLMRTTLDQITSDHTIGQSMATDELFAIAGLRGYLTLRYLDGDFDAHGNNKQIDYDGYSAVAGIERTFVRAATELTLGLAVSAQSLDAAIRSTDAALGTLDVESFGVTGYVAHQSESGMYVRAEAHGALNDYEQMRLNATAATMHAGEPDGESARARIEIGQELDLSATDSMNSTFAMTPFAAIEGAHYRVSHFSEDSDGLRVASFEDSRAALAVGAAMRMTSETHNRRTVVEGSLEVVTELGSPDAVGTRLGTNGRSVFEGYEDDRVSVSLSAGTSIGRDAKIYLRYRGDFADEDTQHGYEAGVAVRF